MEEDLGRRGNVLDSIYAYPGRVCPAMHTTISVPTRVSGKVLRPGTGNADSHENAIALRDERQAKDAILRGQLDQYDERTTNFRLE